MVHHLVAAAVGLLLLAIVQLRLLLPVGLWLPLPVGLIKGGGGNTGVVCVRQLMATYNLAPDFVVSGQQVNLWWKASN